MTKYEFKVNGETFFTEKQSVDAAVLLHIAFKGKAIGENPDKVGYLLRTPNSEATFASGELVNLEEHNVFRAAPTEGAPFA